MSQFVRVKSSRRGDPQHEFDVSVAELEANPKVYAVVDPVPVDESRPPRYVDPPAPPVRRKK